MNREILVVKFGSSSVTNSQGMDGDRLLGYADNLAEAYRRFDLIVVSSGAVAAGHYEWNQLDTGNRQLSDMSAAMMGSADVVVAWKQALRQFDLGGGQLLVTDQEMEDSVEGPRLVRALRENLTHGIITIANENDALCDKELKSLTYGEDNDGLAAHIAIKIGASALFLMTDREGLLGHERLIRHVGTSETERSTAYGYVHLAANNKKGGGRTKLQAALEASGAGIDTYWAQAGSSLMAIMNSQTGTHFVARK